MATDYPTLLRRALIADPAAAAALRRTLAPLVAYDQAHDGDLVRTLAVYFREGMNLSRAANLLFLHRNSLYYRLAHIQALTGLSLDDATHRLWLHLAVFLIQEEQPDNTEETDDPGTRPAERP
jgi:DNA-binding PucR family transcriptional regulator